jgi:hypothetical protein
MANARKGVSRRNGRIRMIHTATYGAIIAAQAHQSEASHVTLRKTPKIRATLKKGRVASARCWVVALYRWA